MKPPLDPKVQAQIDQFAQESAALGAFYEQAIGYVAAQRVAADLSPRPRRYRRWRPGQLAGMVFQLMRRRNRPNKPETDPTIIEGEVIAASSTPVSDDAGTVEATVIVIDIP